MCPKGIGRLSSLITLTQFSIGGCHANEGCKLGELKILNHLQGDLLIEMLRHVDVYEAENAQLKKKIHVRNLRLRFSRMYYKNRIENDVLVLNALEPPPNLKYLEIDGYWSTTMYLDWTMSLAKLKALKLTKINL